MIRLTSLRQYSMAEAIYLRAFDVSEEDLSVRGVEGVIADYAHLDENVGKALETLTVREERILRLVFGEKKSLREVGEEFNISRERVRQIFDKAFRKLSHPSRRLILDGTRRLQRIETEAMQERQDRIEANWQQIEEEIEKQKARQLEQAKVSPSCEIDALQLTQICEEKLRALGITTVGELLTKFPYDARTNGLTGLTIAEGIEECDYQEIWSSLFTAGLLIRLPELPDFTALREAERIAMEGENKKELSNLSTDELELSARSYNCLSRAGIDNVGVLFDRLDLAPNDFLAMDEDERADAIDSLHLRCLGRKSALEIARHLRDELRRYIVSK